MFQKLIWAVFVDAFIADLKQATEVAAKQISEAMQVRPPCASRKICFYLLDLVICHKTGVLTHLPYSLVEKSPCVYLEGR